jgi:hypothetical protein
VHGAWRNADVISRTDVGPCQVVEALGQFLRNRGTRATAYGIHGATAAVMLAIAAVLLLA